MKKLVFIVLSLLFVVSTNYARQPKLVKATIEPAQAAPGDTVKIIVELTGKAKDIKEVSLLPREYAYDVSPYFFKNDPKAGKNVWVLYGPIPYDAPPGLLHLEISAIDRNGKEIVTKDCKNQEFGKTAMLKLTIK